MTDTARYADIVLPATMFLEHDDIYTASAHQHLQFAPKAIEPPEGCRSNHEVICALARRLGADASRLRHEPARDHRRHLAGVGARYARRTREGRAGSTASRPSSDAHFLDGFAHPDKKFHFRADWPNTPYGNDGLRGPWRELPTLPDHWAVNEGADEAHPFKLATSPARNFLNSSFNQTPTSRTREQRPCALMHPEDAASLGLGEGDIVRIGNARGQLRLHVKLIAGATRGVIVSEGLWDNSDFLDGRGINMLTGDDSVAPFGGAAFHDTHVWARAGRRQRSDVDSEAQMAPAAE